MTTVGRSNKKRKHELKRKAHRTVVRKARLAKKIKDSKPKMSDKMGVAHSTATNAGTTKIAEGIDKAAWGIQNG